MEMRDFGRTGMRVSVFGFGCGAVGGLMVRGSPADQQRAVARALDAGINYFDTAVQYGNGASETNLGRVWATLKPAAYVGTKIRFTQAERGNIRAAAAASLDGSLRRLGTDHVDIFHLHNPISADGADESFSATMVLEQVVPAFETAALLRVIDSGSFQSAQVSYNMLNPSAGMAVPEKYPAQDYGRLLDHAMAAGVGVIGIRALAGGALTGTAARHPIASPPPEPIGSALRYEDDLGRARRLAALVAEGHAVSLAEAATRFVIANPAISTMLVGMATEAEFEQALAAVEAGPLSAAALARLGELQRGFVGEPR
jgi:aryl-alcohol dehydrogenase-like predicted oxidoreductase